MKHVKGVRWKGFSEKFTLSKLSYEVNLVIEMIWSLVKNLEHSQSNGPLFF